MSIQTINLTALTPVEHDLLFCERLQLQAEKAYQHGRLADRIVHQYAKRIFLDNGGRWTQNAYISPDTVVLPTTIEEVVPFTIVQALNFAKPHEVAEYTVVKDALNEATALVSECNVEYSRRPWSRYFLVTSSDGHIHSSTYCSTCNKGINATGFALVPYLSGASASDAVADLGSALCSVCFPDAPVADREQVRIPARIALVLAEQGVEAFQLARAKAQVDAQKRASDRCEGSGQATIPSETSRHWFRCPTCGNPQNSSGKVRAHRRPRFYAVKENWKGYNDGWWNGTDWAPSTKKVDLLTKEEAQAIVEAHGGTRVRSE